MSFTVGGIPLLASVVIAVSPGPGAVICMSTGLRVWQCCDAAGDRGLEAALLVHLAVVFARTRCRACGVDDCSPS